MQTYFTDTEYRLLLSALSREMKVCKEVDKEIYNKGLEKEGTICLEQHMRSIERKIRKVQYEYNVKED